VSTTACHLSLPCARLIQSTPSHPISLGSFLIIFSRQHLCLPDGHFPSIFIAKTLYNVHCWSSPLVPRPPLHPHPPHCHLRFVHPNVSLKKSTPLYFTHNQHTTHSLLSIYLILKLHSSLCLDVDKYYELNQWHVTSQMREHLAHTAAKAHNLAQPPYDHIPLTDTYCSNNTLCTRQR